MVSGSAITTRYAGHRFRSRLEARWAVFFDALDLTWEYEPEGFRLPAGPYLPDFWLPTISSWFEVKPAHDAGRDPRWGQLATGLGHRVIVAAGLPRAPRPALAAMGVTGPLDLYFDARIAEYLPGASEAAAGRAFLRCPSCQMVGVEPGSSAPTTIRGQHHHACVWRGPVTWDLHVEGAIVSAYDEARQARFEHGERPMPQAQRRPLVPVVECAGGCGCQLGVDPLPTCNCAGGPCMTQPSWALPEDDFPPMEPCEDCGRLVSDADRYCRNCHEPRDLITSYGFFRAALPPTAPLVDRVGNSELTRWINRVVYMTPLTPAERVLLEHLQPGICDQCRNDQPCLAAIRMAARVHDLSITALITK